MLTALMNRGLLPDQLIRLGIRHLLRKRLEEENRGGLEATQERFNKLLETLRQSPIAVDTDAANEQHYEVPAAFYQNVLGGHLKYSCGYWDVDVNNLTQAEERMLDLTCKRADLEDNQDILELGCGWGSLSLYMARNFPNSRITSVSNSNSQREFIMQRAREYGVDNLTVITQDVNFFETDQKFDRVVSVEMFEHMRNYQHLLDKIAGFLRDDGKLFVHIFTHKEYAYLFEVRDETDWMAKYFFTGGIMPSDHLLLYFSDNFGLEEHWRVNGQHYEKTAEAWLANMDACRAEIMPVFKECYGEDKARTWWGYWRVFFMACAELWGYEKGNEWFVSHYRFHKRPGA